LAFVLGVILLQQQAELPDLIWASLLLPGAAFAFLLRRRGPVFAMTNKLLSCVVLLGAGFFWAALFAHQRLADSLSPEWEGRDIQVIGVIAELPQINGRNVRFAFDVEQVFTTDASVPARVSLGWYPDKDKGAGGSLPAISAGERWRLKVRLKRPHGSINPHGFDFEEWALERNIRATGYVRESAGNVRLDEMVDRPAYRIERLRQEIRERFIQALPDHAYTGVLAALAVGDQRAIPAEQWQVFTRTGINHLMSISGLHVTMVSGLVFALVYAAWRRSSRLTLWLPGRKAAAILGLVAALGYALLAGFAVPAQRTVCMLGVVALALLSGHFTSATSVLVSALLIVTLVDPWAVLSPGFWLSFGAMAVIMLVSVGRIGRMHWLSDWARIQWAITLGLIPALLAMFQQISLVSPLANAIAIPLVSLVVVPLTLLATLPGLEFMLLLAHGVLSVCMDLMQWLSEFPLAVWRAHAPPSWAIAAGVAGVLWMLLPGRVGFFKGLPARWLGGVALLPLFLLLPPKPGNGELWLSVLDVGQGLAVVVRTENHALLYDTGPGAGSAPDSGDRIIVPFLRGEGIEYLDTMIVTHADSDHSGGALSVMEALPVGLLLSSLNEEHPIQLAATPRERCQAGMSWRWDGIQFDVLHPLEQNYDDSRGKTNELSCVVRISTDHGSVLLPSDIERQSEYRLAEEIGNGLSSTVLVAPHHGSKTSSTTEFINQVNPSLVIFPVGYRNRFGHPANVVVQRYKALGSRLLRSDVDGAILLRFAEKGVSVETARRLGRRYWHNADRNDDEEFSAIAR
jgi:competence protein ComEC